MHVAQDAFARVSSLATDELALRVTRALRAPRPRAVGLARRLGATDEQAADVVQEVYLQLWRELLPTSPAVWKTESVRSMGIRIFHGIRALKSCWAPEHMFYLPHISPAREPITRCHGRGE